MLIRSAAAGVFTVLLASCTGAPPGALPPVREGSLTSDPQNLAGLTDPAPPSDASLATPDASASESPIAALPAAAAARTTTTTTAAATATATEASRFPSRDERRSTDEGREVATVPSFRDDGPAPARESPAVLALLANAREAQEAGRYGHAASALERALKVEPRNPRLWHRLALIRFRQGRHAEAAALALRSRSLAGGDPDLDSRNWRLTAAARHALGDEEGARAALRRAEAR